MIYSSRLLCNVMMIDISESTRKRKLNLEAEIAKAKAEGEAAALTKQAELIKQMKDDITTHYEVR